MGHITKIHQLISKILTEIISILYETDNCGKEKLSLGRVLVVSCFINCEMFWFHLRVDAPSTLVTSLGIFAGYVFAGKAKDTVSQYFTTKTNGNGIKKNPEASE